MQDEAKTPSPNNSEAAVAPRKKRATSASNSGSSRSRRKGAKRANTTPPNPERNKVAGFILKKYVRHEKIVYGRDMTVAYKLADRHPDLEFWKQLPIRHQIDTLVILWSQESRNRLTREWQNYSKKLKLQRSIKLDTPAPIYIIGEKVGDDYVPPPRKPRTVVEFCR